MWFTFILRGPPFLRHFFCGQGLPTSLERVLYSAPGTVFFLPPVTPFFAHCVTFLYHALSVPLIISLVAHHFDGNLPQIACNAFLTYPLRIAHFVMYTATSFIP